MSVCFKVQKIIGIAIGEGNLRNYQVLWEPSWVSGFHLVGCENLIDEYLQSEKDRFEDSNAISYPAGEDSCGDNVFTEQEQIKKTSDSSAKLPRRCNSAHHASMVTHHASMVTPNNYLFKSDNEDVLHGDDTYTDDNVHILYMEREEGNQECREIDSQEMNANPNFEWNNSIDAVPACDTESMDYNEIERQFQSANFEVKSEEDAVVKKNAENSVSSDNEDDESPTIIVKDLPGSQEELKDSLAKNHPLTSRIENKKLINDNEFQEIDEQPNSTILFDEFKCRICSKNFTNSSGLTRHCNRIHGVGQRFACNICNENFKCQISLQRHKRLHTADKDFVCTVCGEQFKDRQEFHTHMRTHTPNRRHPCSDCGKSFRARTDLLRHQRVHTNERPFVCDVCPKRFKINDHLQKHLKTHKETTAK